jgi:hypothetical protein
MRLPLTKGEKAAEVSLSGAAIRLIAIDVGECPFANLLRGGRRAMGEELTAE